MKEHLATMICAIGCLLPTLALGQAAPGTVQQTISHNTHATTYAQPNHLDPLTVLHAAAPGGLTLVCHLYGEADQGASAHHGSEECDLPVGAKIDTSYHQDAFPTPCSGGGAVTTLTLADVPQGIYLSCDGGYYWAVLGPVRLIALQFDNNGNVVQWGVNISDLYCGPGGSPNGGCNVKLDVYAKLKQ